MLQAADSQMTVAAAKLAGERAMQRLWRPSRSTTIKETSLEIDISVLGHNSLNIHF